MRKDIIISQLQVAGVALAALSLGACVDDTYDLDKDIDTDVTINGNITTPPITVEPITMENILDLDDDSNVKALYGADATRYGLQDGDYVFMPDKSEGSRSNVDVQAVKFKTNSDKWAGRYPIPEFEIPEGALDYLDQPQFSWIKDKLTDTEVPGTEFSIDFSTNDIPGELRSFSDVSIKPTAINLHFDLEGDNGGTLTLTYKPGFSISLPESFVPDIAKSKARGGFTNYTYSNHTITLNEDYRVGTSPDIILELADLDMTPFEFTPGTGTHGNYKDNGELNGKMQFKVQGHVAINCTKEGVIAPKLTFRAITASEIEILAVKGVVDPDVNITVNPINVTGVPSCLEDDNTDLNISNPMIFLTIDNPTGLAVDLGEIAFSSKKGAAVAGTAQTDAITIEPGINKIVISPKSVGNAEWKHIACAELPDIIRRIPDHVYVEIPDAHVVQDVQEVMLDKHYTVTTDYDIVAPLAMKEGSQIRYEETMDGLSDDLDDIDEIGCITATIDYTNTIPMTMQVHNNDIVVLDAQGKAINDVTVTVEGNVKSGSIEAPAQGTLKVTIALRDGGNLKNFDGMKLVFWAITDKEAAGRTLNSAQTLTINKAQLTISGGVTVEI